MTGTDELTDEPPAGGDLRARVDALVEAVTRPRAQGSDADDPVLSAATEIVHRKLGVSDSKSPSRASLHAAIEARMRDALAAVAAQAGGDPHPAELLLGSLLTADLLGELADAVDRLVVEARTLREFSLAGLADFISLEEVLQLLGGGSHCGCLSLERPDNTIDVYFDHSTVAFLDPQRIVRRVLPTPDGIAFREIGQDLLSAAEAARDNDDTPICVSLHEQGFFRESEVRDMARRLGIEVLYEFLDEQSDCAYRYRRMSELPAFALRYNLKMPVTPILLEGNKRLDDWRSMKRVFPDPDQPLEPVDDMFARISQMQLGVLEIKMLAQIGDRASPRELAPRMGLPLHEVYQRLIHFAKEGVLQPPGGEESMAEVATSIEESVQMAMKALDDNDDESAVSSVLDRVLGGDDGELFGGRDDED